MVLRRTREGGTLSPDDDRDEDRPANFALRGVPAGPPPRGYPVSPETATLKAALLGMRAPFSL